MRWYAENQTQNETASDVSASSSWHLVWMIPLAASLTPIGWIVAHKLLKLDLEQGVYLALGQTLVVCLLHVLTNGGE